MQSLEFPWSNNWWIEKDKAWFCAGRIGALFCVDMNSGCCELVAQIPEDTIMGRWKYPFCIKHGNTIFCLPSRQKYIWCYDMSRQAWEKIEIEHRDSIMVWMKYYRPDDARVWLREGSYERIFEINLEKKSVEKEIYFPKNDNVCAGQYTLVQNKLYCIDGNKIHCIVVSGDEGIITYKVSGVQAGLCVICYDGSNFWLSGYCKEIYIWNPEQGVVKTITDFPEGFGVYHFGEKGSWFVDCNSSFFIDEEDILFTDAISLGRYIWYIPEQANKILYIDKETYEIHILEVEGEQETEESIKRKDKNALKIKYVVEYIRDNRYIGLYSFKNLLIFEIDTVELCVRTKNYTLSDDTVRAIASAYYEEKKILREYNKTDQMFFGVMLENNIGKEESTSQNIGERIHCTINN